MSLQVPTTKRRTLFGSHMPIRELLTSTLGLWGTVQPFILCPQRFENFSGLPPPLLWHTVSFPCLQLWAGFVSGPVIWCGLGLTSSTVPLWFLAAAESLSGWTFWSAFSLQMNISSNTSIPVFPRTIRLLIASSLLPPLPPSLPTWSTAE